MLKRTWRMSATKKWSIKFAKQIKEKRPKLEAMRIFSSRRVINPVNKGIIRVTSPVIRVVISPARAAINPVINSITSSLRPPESKTRMPMATR